MNEKSCKVVGVFSDLVTKKEVRVQRQKAKEEIKLHRTELDRIVPHKRTSCIPLCLPPLEKDHLKCKRDAVSSTPESVMNTICAVNQLAFYHAVSIWYN